MTPPQKILRAAAAHVSPIFLSATQTTQKALNLIHQASNNKANLIVFPETFISAFPLWSALCAPTENHSFFTRMVQNSICIDGPEMLSLRTAAQKHDIMISMGFSERATHTSAATLYNSNVMITADGKIANHHRKLQPTFFEKLTWSPGDGHGLRVVESGFGKIGQLICGENTNPLARYALMAQGEEIHISTWPAVWPTRSLGGEEEAAAAAAAAPSTGEKDKNKNKNYDNLAANRTRAAAHCFEAKCFGIVNAAFLDNTAITTISNNAKDSAGVKKTLQLSQRAATMFLDPTGTLMPAYTINAETGEKQETEYLQLDQGILYADLDVSECVEGKQYHDVVGGYQRFDVFDLKVDRSRREPATFYERNKKDTRDMSELD
jgi:nitrilase